MKSILLVDDDRVILKIFTKYCKDLGYNPVTVESGHEAWDLIQGSAINKLKNYVAVFSDVMMEDGEGLTLLENIREHKTIGSIPFILVSGSDDEFFKTDSKRFGVNDYLVKPVTFQQFKECLEKHLKL